MNLLGDILAFNPKKIFIAANKISIIYKLNRVLNYERYCDFYISPIDNFIIDKINGAKPNILLLEVDCLQNKFFPNLTIINDMAKLVPTIVISVSSLPGLQDKIIQTACIGLLPQEDIGINLNRKIKEIWQINKFINQIKREV